MAKTNWNLDQLSIGQQEALLALTNQLSLLSLKPKTFTKIDSIKTFYKLYTKLYYQYSMENLDLDFDNEIIKFIMDNTIVESIGEPLGDLFHDPNNNNKIDPIELNFDMVSITKNLIKKIYNI